MNPLSIAARGKGFIGMVKRANTISRQYGITASKMDRLLTRFVMILSQYNSGATFPITTAALMRRNGFHQKYQEQNIEFAVHGYYHIDHTQLSYEEQIAYLELAGRRFQDHRLSYQGFRCPYLRWNEDTLAALRNTGFLYDSSQGLSWEVTNGIKTSAYQHVLEFYGAIPVDQYPALPRLDEGLVRIPYSLPDDEALIDRFHLQSFEPMSEIWLSILAESYRLGELFTLGLHPERLVKCEKALIATLHKARELSPFIWIARLDKIAEWWKARMQAEVTISQKEGNEYHITVKGMPGISILCRGVDMITRTEPWDAGYRKAVGTDVHLRSNRIPFIGVSRSSAPSLINFLKQQGYIVEQTEDSRPYSFYLDRPHFSYEEERPILARIEQSDFPLVRLGRWPDGARSALCVTGDIDALTIWDYSLRFFGR